MEYLRKRPSHAKVRIGALTVATAAALYEGIGSGATAPLTASLCLFAAGAALAWRRSGSGLMIRFAPAFILAGWIAFSPAAGLWIGLAALVVQPVAVAGMAGRPGVEAVAATVALLGTYGTACLLKPGEPDGSGLQTAILAPVLYLVLAGLALGCAWLLRDRSTSRSTVNDARSALHTGFLEMLNIPMAWILASYLEPIFRPGSLLLLASLILLGAWGLRKLAQARSELQTANDALAARVSELATLHSIGREIVSSLDLQKVFIIVERECRKILDISRFSISLTEPASGVLENVYQHTRGKSGGRGGKVRRVEKWVAAEKRGMRIGHGADELVRRGLRHAGGTGDFPSTLAVPLIVEERIVGVLMVQSVLRDAYDEHHLAVLTTIAQQAAVAIENARHYRMATVDSLTGVSLREYFFRRVREEHHRASRYHSRFALLMIDLDGFKEINDSHGHQVGDRYLNLLGAEIRSHLRAADLACRYGGDEFCILLPETGFEGAHTIAERLRRAIAGLTLSTNGEPARATVSIGMAMFPDHGADSLSSLLKHADQALYRAKRQGKDQVLPYTPRTGRPAVRRPGPVSPPRNIRRAGRTDR